MTDRYQVRFFQIPRWLAVLAGVTALAFAIALFLLSLTVFLVLLPMIAVAGALYYLYGKLRKPRSFAGTREIIDAEYRVVDPERIEQDRERR